MDDTPILPEIDFLALTAELVAAYVCNNSVPVLELPALLTKVHTTLLGLSGKILVETTIIEKPTPAQVKKSITSDGLISFEDGKSYKTLRRHLTIRGLTPEAYRQKHGLPLDYPMVSAAYSAQRSKLARSLGLGRSGRPSSQPETSEAGQTSDDATPVKRRGRPPGKANAVA